MPQQNKPFRCESPDCPNETFYHTLTKPPCPVCGEYHSVIPLEIIHLLVPVDEDSDEVGNYGNGLLKVACGKKNPIYLTSLSQAATCHNCLSNLKDDPEPEQH